MLMLIARLITAIAVLCLMLLVDGWAAPSGTMGTPSAQGAEAHQPIALPEHLTPEQARDLVSLLSDGEARELLLTQVDKLPPPAEVAPAEPASMLFGVQADMYVLRNRLKELFSALPDLPSIGPFIVTRITKGYGPDHVWTIASYLTLIFGGALAGEALFRRMFRPLLSHLPMIETQSDFGKLGVLLLRALIQLLAIAAFSGVAILLFLFLYEGHEAARFAFWTVFAFIVLVRMSSVVLCLILAPHQLELRLPALDDRTARRLYWDFSFLIALSFASVLIGTFLQHIGVAPDLMLAAGELLLLLNVVALIAVIWAQRSGIARLVGVGPAETKDRTTGLSGLFTRYWHIFAVTYVFAMGVLATVHRLLTGETQGSRALPTLGVLIGIPLIDGLLRMTVRRFFGRQEGTSAKSTPALMHRNNLRGPADEGITPLASAVPAPPAERQNDDTDYGRVILRNGRILLAVVGVIVLAEIWDIHLQVMATQGLGPRIAGSLFDIVITLILASAGWGIIKTAINRQLPHESLDALALADGEALGSGLSRLETLLPLLRKFLFIALIVIVAMIVISSMGISIGPLLAGAGVIGIALGFGAQTLVRDIISGIFFLIDDAFRVGEYIDVGEGKGTVERMSVRSLMLRHHLGQINTIPFGVIRRVTNYSRDWAIMKLELRVPFDTDMEKLRKIVKKVGAEMMADPEYGANFIQPLKSQGVHRMDDSSFIVRVKFMARPGEQFVLRREVFRRVQEAFQQSGIKFAPRRVIVDAPTTPSGAAAAAVVRDPAGNNPLGEVAL